ncbi:MAG: DEAD/DEAH box helicase [Myxococcales bacterium]|nr:DEAD/DEAH box helicase [Myxococcales bacterium]MCB9630504.1 DEAD/DEAH box helicase [Sandaracinaceae bacterium]
MARDCAALDFGGGQGHACGVSSRQTSLTPDAGGRSPTLEDVELLVALVRPFTSRSKLCEAALLTGVGSAGGRQPSVAELAPHLEVLEQRGVIQPTSHTAAYVVCEPALRWPAVRAGHQRGRLARLAELLLDDAPQHAHAQRHRAVELLADTAPVQVALLMGKTKEAQRWFWQGLRYDDRPQRIAAFAHELFGAEPNVGWLSFVGPRALTLCVSNLVTAALERLEPVNDDVLWAALTGDSAPLRGRAARLARLRGGGPDLGEIKLGKVAGAEVELVAAMLRGDFREALRHADTVNGKDPEKPRALDPDVRAALLWCWIIASGEDAGAWVRLTTRLVAERRERGYAPQEDGLESFVHALQFGRPHPNEQYAVLDAPGASWAVDLSFALLRYWRAGAPAADASSDYKSDALAYWRQRAVASGAAQVARALDELRHALAGRDPSPGSLAAAYTVRAGWELALEALAEFAAEDQPREQKADGRGTGERLVWELSIMPRQGVLIRALHFKTAATRVGRELRIEKLLTGDHPYLTEQDRAVLAHAEPDELGGSGRRARVPAMTLKPSALLALIGHDAVVDAEGQPLRVLRGEGELRAEALPSGATRVSLHPRELAHTALLAVPQPPDQLVVIERTPELARLAHLLTQGVLEVPPAGAARLGVVLGQVGRRVRVGAGEDVQITGELVPTETRLAFLCRFSGQRLEVRLRAVPLGLAGPQALPGRGPTQMVAVVDGKPLRTERNLQAELQAKQALFIAAPGLATLTWEEDSATLDGLPGAYDFLTEVGALDEQTRLVAWPDGRSLPVPRSVGVDALRVRVRGAGGKLLTAIEVEVDADLVVDYERLVASQASGRFVHLDDHTILRLTGELRRRLDAFGALGKLRKDGLASDPVLLPRLVELSEDVGARTLDAASQRRLQSLEEALRMDVPLPRGFEAELRDYQRAGFEWLARLGEAQLGACLADDMGLGKTVQTLALLAHRAKQGPALVVAPTSVVGAWLSEAARFAPRLNVTLLAESSDRAALIAGAGARDVLVATYGVLVTEAQALTARSFATVVFDEAHALKNASTQRAQAAAQLQAGFRVALTGTPIENHLGELWSLMRAVVPGLLGSEREFALRFVDPIAAGKRERLADLRQRLRPFLLRRTKAEVLEELPERSETTLLVTPTPEERAYYEALRRQVAQRLLAQREAPTGQARVEILAEITRLRQVAVDPRLFDAKHGPPGAKLDVLAERVRALHDEGHQPLIFTQFLGSLARIEERLAQEGLTVLTLDGSMSAKERTKRVAAFQAGEADAFVMSLHAGGTGVTLTAADYVFHVDPWWNPAVEEQATGRAHRIGQRRPVHVYRLVTAGTIEEKILALHKRKRRLTSDLLEGLDSAQKLDLETLRALIDA